jgi:uncharacterized membrane protein
LAAISSGAQQAQAGLHFCNDAGVHLEIAISYPDGKGAWIAEGWWLVEPGQCTDVIVGPLKSRYYYFFAHGLEGTKFSGKTPYCIQTKKFTLNQKRFGKRTEADCARAGLRVENFKEMDTGKSKDFTNRLAGRAPPAPVSPAPTAAGGGNAQQHPSQPAAAASPQQSPPAPSGPIGGTACQRYPNLC